MINEPKSMSLKEIGIVRNEVKQSQKPGFNWQDIESEIVVEASLAEALDGLEDFSHIIVIWWMHKADARKTPAKIHPRGNPELPLVGIFATRSPHRPNPVGKATVKLMKREGRILKVKGLDAIDGTPVIDIKPHIPGSDSPADARVPKWISTQ